MEDNSKGHTPIKKVMNLALLPPRFIPVGLKLIKDEVEKTFVNHQTMLLNWKKFFEYVENQWMKSVTAEGFSVFQCVDRTNNYIESYHRGANSKIGGKKTPREFLSLYLSIISNTRKKTS